MGCWCASCFGWCVMGSELRVVGFGWWVGGGTWCKVGVGGVKWVEGEVK